MTKEQWRATCSRIQNRLENIAIDNVMRKDMAEPRRSKAPGNRRADREGEPPAQR